MVKKIKKEIDKNTVLPSEILFETSWEVCNKVGGIYTVLSTKACELKKIYGDRLVFVGPDVWDARHESPYFIERKTLLKNATAKMQLPDGIKIRVGRWDIPGTPIVVLVKFQHLIGKINNVYASMWEKYGVDSLHGYGDYDEACAFAVASAKVIESLTTHLGEKCENVLAHFDEWTTGMGLLELQQLMPEATTVFTTHATSIGRSISGNGKPLYDYFRGYNGDQMARELNMESKHSLEKAAAHNADCFTAVSEITADECEQLLDIRPQVVTPNGFEPDFVPSAKKYAALRKEGRKKLLEIASSLRGKNYDDDTLIVATSGRNEYRNKGLDVYLDSIARLEELRGSADDNRDIVAFVLVPAWVKAPNGILNADNESMVQIQESPDYMTHRLYNEEQDALASRVRMLEGEGKFKDVAVIYVPCYLDSNDGVVDINYYDLLPALDITVFASYYEPWGYTPLESVAFGVPTVTTDKSGFGQWVADTVGIGLQKSGVEVFARNDSNYDKLVSDISETLDGYSKSDSEIVAKVRQACRHTASKAEWNEFITEYADAYKVAMKRRGERLCSK